MKAREKRYAENEVIFYEGDASTAVYVIVSGCVELSKETHDGAVLLATLGPGEMFGEMGILDGNPRSASAMAIQESIIQVVTRKDFLRSLREEPDQAMAVMHKLVERLRGADSLLAGAQHKPEKRGLLGTLLGLLRRRRHHGPVTAALPNGSAAAFLVVITQLNGDIEAQMADYLRSVLDGRDGLRVIYVGRPLRLDDSEDPAQLSSAGLNARQLLAEERADLVIWGDVSDEGDLHLRFTPVAIPEEERPGGFALTNCLDLPVGFDDAMLEFLYAIVLAAIEPQNEAQSILQRRVLPPAAEAIMDLGAKPSMSIPLASQRAHLICFGHILATLGALSPTSDTVLFDRAIASYRSAAARVGRHDSQSELVAIHKHLAAVHIAMAERRVEDPEPLEQAIEAYHTVLEGMLKSAFPLDWAITQNRLGLALYRLDLRTGRTELLKEALAAYQLALQTFTKQENPARWAEVMHNLAQALEVYGDQMRSPDVLERAIDACRLVSESLSRDTSPLAWAAIQNTLGSALYLRDKHGHSTEHLEAAEETLRGALEIYLGLGHEKPALVTRRNLAHVQKLRKMRKDVKLIEPDWADDSVKRLPGPEAKL